MGCNLVNKEYSILLAMGKEYRSAGGRKKEKVGVCVMLKPVCMLFLFLIAGVFVGWR